MKLFVSNLEFFKVNEDTLRELFSQYGQVQSVRIPINAQGISRGFGFVEMFDDEAASAAILNLNGTMLEGRRLSVSEARRESKG